MANFDALNPEARRVRYTEQLLRLDFLKNCTNRLLPLRAVLEVTKPFGFEGTARRFYNGEDGLKLAGGALSAMGQNAAVLAVEICERVGVKYEKRRSRTMQLTECCSCLKAHIIVKLSQLPR